MQKEGRLALFLFSVIHFFLISKRSRDENILHCISVYTHLL